MTNQLPNLDIELNFEQKAQIQHAKDVLPKLKEQVKRAKLAGIDLPGMEEQIKVLEEQVSKLHNVYVRPTG